jgi:hypothetical protein
MLREQEKKHPNNVKNRTLDGKSTKNNNVDRMISQSVNKYVENFNEI